MTVTVYSKPDCVQCTATYRALDSNAIEYTVIDLTTDPIALERVRALGYQQAPVVVAADNDHWSGFRPDKISHLAAALTAAGVPATPPPLTAALWVNEHTTAAERANYAGRVDFETNDGNVILTLEVTPKASGDGYDVQLQNHTDAPVELVDVDPTYALRSDLKFLTERYAGIVFNSEGDPSSFDPGHLVLTPESRLGAYFAIQELYPAEFDTRPMEDDTELPVVGYEWALMHPDHILERGQVTIDRTGELLERAKVFCDQHAPTPAAGNPSTPLQTVTPPQPAPPELPTY